MSQNPYESPRAAVADRPAASKPREIRIALALMWFSLLAGSVYGIVGGPTADPEAEMSAGAWAILGVGALVVIGIFAIPLAFIALRKNWARWVWLALMILSWLMTLFFWEGVVASTVDMALNLFFALIDITAAFLVFSGAGARWFQD